MIYFFSLFSFFTLATASEKSASKEAECEKPVVENIVAFNGDTIKVNRTVRKELVERLKYSYEGIGNEKYHKDSVVNVPSGYAIKELYDNLIRIRDESGEEHVFQYDCTYNSEIKSKETENEEPVVKNIVAFNGKSVRVKETLGTDSIVSLVYSYEGIGNEEYHKDSVVNPNGTYNIYESLPLWARFRYESGEEHFIQYDREGKIIKSYFINMESKAKLYDEKGNLLPYCNIRGDTVFLETRFLNGGFWN
jgi:hypothetical protein